MLEMTSWSCIAVLHTKAVVIHAPLTLSRFRTMIVLVVLVPYSMAPTSSADPQGVGPAQNWYVVADGVNDKFHYEFGLKGEYGAPSQIDGHVPQVYATWVNGLTPGRYYARAWVFRYVQTALDGSTFQEYSFQVTPNEWAGDISLPMDLRISSWINKTVHFHDNAGTIGTDPVAQAQSSCWWTLRCERRVVPILGIQPSGILTHTPDIV